MSSSATATSRTAAAARTIALKAHRTLELRHELSTVHHAVRHQLNQRGGVDPRNIKKPGRQTSSYAPGRPLWGYTWSRLVPPNGLWRCPDLQLLQNEYDIIPTTDFCGAETRPHRCPHAVLRINWIVDVLGVGLGQTTPTRLSILLLRNPLDRMVSGYFYEVAEWKMRLVQETGRLCGCIPHQDDYVRLHDWVTSHGLVLPAMCHNRHAQSRSTLVTPS